MKKLFSVIALIVILAACSDEAAVSLGPQQWQDFSFMVESRPSPLRVGMNEFIVIVNREGYKPGVGLIVSLRADDKAEWRQAIQDGFSGVYRRAIQVNDPQSDVLAVHVSKSRAEDGGEETTLYFPLKQAVAKTH
jgi:hypothetical protein